MQVFNGKVAGAAPLTFPTEVTPRALGKGLCEKAWTNTNTRCGAGLSRTKRQERQEKVRGNLFCFAENANFRGKHSVCVHI